MATYSFEQVFATLTGAAGVISLGAGSANAKEGITITKSQTRNTMTIGADGAVMHSLKADKSGTVTVRLLETSPVNSLLQTMLNAQALSPTAWGNNVLVVVNKSSGETTTCRNVAFQGDPEIVYSEEGQVREWTFDCGMIDTLRGDYE